MQPSKREAAHLALAAPEQKEVFYRVYSGPTASHLPTKEERWPFRECSKLSQALFWAQCVARQGTAVIAIGRDFARTRREKVASNDRSTTQAGAEPPRHDRSLIGRLAARAAARGLAPSEGRLADQVAYPNGPVPTMEAITNASVVSNRQYK